MYCYIWTNWIQNYHFVDFTIVVWCQHIHNAQTRCESSETSFGINLPHYDKHSHLHKCQMRHVFTMRITHCHNLKAQKLSVLNRSCLYAQTSFLGTYDCVCEGFIMCEGICCTANSVSVLHALAACCSNSICQSLRAKECACVWGWRQHNGE